MSSSFAADSKAAAGKREQEFEQVSCCCYGVAGLTLLLYFRVHFQIEMPNTGTAVPSGSSKCRHMAAGRCLVW
jgi:hypothetical protein